MIGRMKIPFATLLSAALIAGAAMTGAASPGSAQTAKGSAKSPTPKELYVSNCQMCHGPDGKAAIPTMSFVGRKWKTKSQAEAVKTIREGVPGTVMLPFKGKLTEPQIAALARYVRSLDKPAPKAKK